MPVQFFAKLIRNGFMKPTFPTFTVAFLLTGELYFTLLRVHSLLCLKITLMGSVKKLLVSSLGWSTYVEDLLMM